MTVIRTKAKPFLKWAGGKTQLLATISNSLPFEISLNKFTYIEPFVGSGAVMFWMLNNFPKLENVVINDINSDLINAYRVIEKEPKNLLSILKFMQNEYHALQNNDEQKKEYYYLKREVFNARNTDTITHAALFIFLNRTCFNGLYRVNSKNLLNVPWGSYIAPTICDESNIMAVSNALKRVEILNVDFEETLSYAGKQTFFYLDPPYKPISKTASFNSYSKDVFDDKEQIRLSNFCNTLNAIGHKWLLSNSDVNDSFFDDLFQNYKVNRVKATRRINSDGEKRGEVSELLITNYTEFKLELQIKLEL